MTRKESGWLDRLHAQIMNLPAFVPGDVIDVEEGWYLQGHRDARHAAAELVSANLTSLQSAAEGLEEAAIRYSVPSNRAAFEAGAQWLALKLATPPAQAAQHRSNYAADLIDTFEQLRKIAGTPEQDADALIAAVRTRFSAQAAQADEPTHEQLRAIAREARNQNGPSDITPHTEFVRAGWRAALTQRPAAPLATDAGVPTLQGGLSNQALVAEWQKRLPGVEPTDRQLSVFAVGVEAGFEHARKLEKADWGRVHHALKDAGVHPGRTDEHIADVIARALAAHPAAERPAQGEALEPHPPHRQCGCPDCAPSFAQGEVGVADTRRLDALRDNSWDLRCFDIPTGGGDADIGWRVIEHLMGKPYEREVGVAFRDDPREAIDAALAAHRAPEGGRNDTGGAEA